MTTLLNIQYHCILPSKFIHGFGTIHRIDSGCYLNIINKLIFVTATCLQGTVFWDVAPCSLVEVQRFRGAYCFHHHGALMMDVNVANIHVN
jgi:hypothetical protein